MVEDTGRVRAVGDYWRLLAAAAVQCRRHKAWQREPFNVFSVLRSGSDEVNLHSRFLAALLAYRKAPDAPRENLEDFLKSVVKYNDFNLSSAMIERERDNIDILVSNSAKQAVVIENKIWAGDQPRQLQRYRESLKERGFRDENIRLVYLTPHGRAPSKDSKGDLNVARISYANTLLPWLERCQKRAYEEPSLREAIDQYLRLVRKLTGTDQEESHVKEKEAYMKELRKLCVEGDNSHLVHDMTEALIDVKVDLLIRLWEDIECSLKTMVDLQSRKVCVNKACVDIGRDIANYVRGKVGYNAFGLYWPLQGWSASVSLGVVMLEERILLGIRLPKSECPTEYAKLGEIARNAKSKGMEDRWDSWPCSKWVDSSLLPENFNRDHLVHHRWEHVEFLRDEGRRKTLVAAIAEDLKQVWDAARGKLSA